MRTIDLNADVGEGSPRDAELIPLVTSANIACGGHAGDERTMQAAARVAIEHGVAIGAHPGHEDRENFGRRELEISPEELRALLERQVNRLHRVVRGLGGELRYLKLHGGLYHQTSREDSLAEAVAQFVNDFHVPLALLGMPGTTIQRAAVGQEIEFAREAFPDRLYQADGSLTPRSTPGAVLIESSEIAKHASELVPTCDSLCLHGDEAHSVDNARAVREALEASGYKLQAFTA